MASARPSDVTSNLRTMPVGLLRFVDACHERRSQKVISQGELSSSHHPLPETRVWPFGVSARQESCFRPGRIFTVCRLPTSQIRIVPSKLQENNSVSSPLNTTPVTPAVCPVKVAKQV